MFWRRICRSDFDACFEIRPQSLGQELISRTGALKVWGELLRHAAFNGIVVETQNNRKLARIIAFACSVFVTDEFANEELSHPRPGLNARFVAAMAHQRPVALSSHQIREANSGAGLNVLVLAGNWAGGLSMEELFQVKRLFEDSFVELHAGYRFQRMMFEFVTAAETEYGKTAHMWRFFSPFDRGDPMFPPGDGPGRGRWRSANEKTRCRFRLRS